MATGILSKTELIELTGTKQLTKQISMLMSEGIPFFFSPPMAYPRTTWETVNEVLRSRIKSAKNVYQSDADYDLNEDALKEIRNAKNPKCEK